MRDDNDNLVSRLRRAWDEILNLSTAQGIGPDSLKLIDNQTSNEWDVVGAVLLSTNDDSQWTVQFTPNDTSKPLYCEFTFKYQITSGGTPYSFGTYSWDDPSTTTSNVKKFIVWRPNEWGGDQVIDMKFGVRSSLPGVITWTRDR